MTVCMIVVTAAAVVNIFTYRNGVLHGTKCAKNDNYKKTGKQVFGSGWGTASVGSSETQGFSWPYP